MFRADLSAQTLVRVNKLGLNFQYTLLLLAAEVGVTENCVYFPEAQFSSCSVSWKGFGLQAVELMQGQAIPNTITESDFLLDHDGWSQFRAKPRCL